MPTDRPNVLLVVADDLRFDVPRNDAVHTPNFDRLVDDGMVFTRAYNMGSDSGAVCVPARAMIHSGRSLFRLDGRHGITEAHPTLGEAFENAGYGLSAPGSGTTAPNRSIVRSPRGGTSSSRGWTTTGTLPSRTATPRTSTRSYPHTPTTWEPVTSDPGGRSPSATHRGSTRRTCSPRRRSTSSRT